MTAKERQRVFNILAQRCPEIVERMEKHEIGYINVKVAHIPTQEKRVIRAAWMGGVGETEDIDFEIDDSYEVKFGRLVTAKSDAFYNALNIGHSVAIFAREVLHDSMRRYCKKLGWENVRLTNDITPYWINSERRREGAMVFRCRLGHGILTPNGFVPLLWCSDYNVFRTLVKNGCPSKQAMQLATGNDDNRKSCLLMSLLAADKEK